MVIKSELAKIGIDVDIQTYELLTAYDKEDGGNSQMGQRYWTNDIIDPDEVATFAVDPKGGANAFNTYWSTRGDRAGAQGPRRARPEEARPMYEQIQKIVYDESPFLVLDYSPYRYAQGTWVTASTSRRSATTTCRCTRSPSSSTKDAPEGEGRDGRYRFLGRRFLQLIPVLSGSRSSCSSCCA